MFDRIIHFFVPDHSDSLSYKFNTSVPSSYFKRFAVAWVFWNWKIILLLFFVSEGMVVSKHSGARISKTDWIAEQYDSAWKITLYVIFLPAVSALVIYAVLELMSCANYYVVKKAWKKRADIENRINGVTTATNKMVSEYLEEKNTDQLKLNQLANDILYKEDLLKKSADELRNLRKENASLSLRTMELENSEITKQLQGEVHKLIERIKKAARKENILSEFETNYRRIKGNGGRLKIGQPSPDLEFLVHERLFKKENGANEYSITPKGDMFNAYIVLQEYDEL